MDNKSFLPTATALPNDASGMEMDVVVGVGFSPRTLHPYIKIVMQNTNTMRSQAKTNQHALHRSKHTNMELFHAFPICSTDVASWQRLSECLVNGLA